MFTSVELSIVHQMIAGEESFHLKCNSLALFFADIELKVQ